MLRLIPFLLLTVLLASCSESTADAEVTTEAPAAVTATTPAPTPPNAQDGTLLCEVSGQPWNYTKASGIITTDRKTKARTAIITFKKKLDKGSESIQLYYDADTYELQKISLQLKLAKTDGKLFTGFYDLNGANKYNWLPGSSLKGSVDLSDAETVSGTAEVIDLAINYEKENLANAEDGVVSVSGLRFSGIGYSDLSKVKEKLGI